MKNKVITLTAAFAFLLCCKNEANERKSSKLHSDRALIGNQDSSKSEKISVVKNNEYLMFNDKKLDQ